jgi:RimJ/RimL family protein N-acetyltransferase
MASEIEIESGNRVLLRRWRDEDLAPFATMNDDFRVMEFFPNRLSHEDSDALAERIQQHFREDGFGLWAVEVTGVAPFIGFVGLSIPNFTAHFTPCVEIGWRLAFEHWGCGYATEAAHLALMCGFRRFALPSVVSFTAIKNRRSRALMERLKMRRDPTEDFDHPLVPAGHAFRRHVLYRLDASSYFGTG